MLENTPTQSTMTELLGQPLFAVWQELCSAIDEKYDMERLWNTGGKNWVYKSVINFISPFFSITLSSEKNENRRTSIYSSAAFSFSIF